MTVWPPSNQKSLRKNQGPIGSDSMPVRTTRMLGTLLSWSLAWAISYRTGTGLLVSESTVPRTGLSEDWQRQG